METQPKTKEIVYTENAVPPLPVFSQATIANGVVYCSGSIGCDHQLKLIPGGVAAQTTRALENLSAVLVAAGSGIEHILKANVYLANMPRDFGTMNEAYIKFFTGPPPARTCVGVAALPMGADVEIECTAVVPRQGAQ
ncbi:YjgF-like protein [Ceratobasidium sp. AG-I]|nr:YjgF-like protein [Ceratobasidium sp. AG-I]